MPMIRLEMLPGRTAEQKRDFAREVTRVAVETLKCKPESVDVVITEIPKSHWAKGGELMGD
ncbi:MULTISPECIES: 4-oxalocrotonate tautomerase [Rahnella]|jgi:4-oxalocrotonate tautomerase|uniref:Tautomerase n=2 Tax=Yersiniaceae TaxID=1903411 RepID=A0ABX9PS18_9GAMM|nr:MULTISPECIES: 4-oxalocrotonate tautomerase [Rahnella]TCQ86117.1 4-oxalocrotonate tautomerase [Rahnella sp. JUb53]MDH2898071.1 4-oxalocrotonate tautomerase [Rahnella variigena]PBI80997.1 4-oxalocrotonate tautomerase [Rahnella victoriana]RBQ35080.1 4-oxalocrotonate tautomerase [Rahnella aquatilis]RJT50623.1 4-oxalocrotonate tautomerase [Rahnella variigena]